MICKSIQNMSEGLPELKFISLPIEYKKAKFKL